MIRIYPYVSSNKVCGVFSRCRIGFRKMETSMVNTTAVLTPSTKVPAIECLNSFSLFSPKRLATIIAKPLVKPYKNPTTRLLIDVDDPTAANALLPSKFPTIFISVRL